MKERRVGPSGDVAGLDSIESFVEPTNLDELLQQYRVDGDKSALRTVYEPLCYTSRTDLFRTRFLVLDKAIDKLRVNDLSANEVTKYIKSQLHFKVNKREDELTIESPESTYKRRKKADKDTGKTNRTIKYSDPFLFDAVNTRKEEKDWYDGSENCQILCNIIRKVAKTHEEQTIVEMLMSNRSQHARLRMH